MPTLFDANFFTAKLARIWPFLHALRVHRLSRPLQAREDARIEARFRTLFSTSPTAQRNSLIRYYQKKHGCTRIAAMNRAIEDHSADETRWM